MWEFWMSSVLLSSKSWRDSLKSADVTLVYKVDERKAHTTVLTASSLPSKDVIFGRHQLQQRWGAYDHGEKLQDQGKCQLSLWPLDMLPGGQKLERKYSITTIVRICLIVWSKEGNTSTTNIGSKKNSYVCSVAKTKMPNTEADKRYSLKFSSLNRTKWHRAPLYLESCSGKDCPSSISS